MSTKVEAIPKMDKKGEWMEYFSLHSKDANFDIVDLIVNYFIPETTTIFSFIARATLWQLKPFEMCAWIMEIEKTNLIEWNTVATDSWRKITMDLRPNVVSVRFR